MSNKNANVARGEVPVTVRGEKFVMYLSTGALAALEEKFGKFEAMAESFKEAGLKKVLDFLKVVAEVNADDDDGELVMVSRMRADESPKAMMDLMQSLPTDGYEVGDEVEKPKANRATRRKTASNKTNL